MRTPKKTGPQKRIRYEAEPPFICPMRSSLKQRLRVWCTRRNTTSRAIIEDLVASFLLDPQAMADHVRKVCADFKGPDDPWEPQLPVSGRMVKFDPPPIVPPSKETFPDWI